MHFEFVLVSLLIFFTVHAPVDIANFEDNNCNANDRTTECVNHREHECCDFRSLLTATWSVGAQGLIVGDVFTWYKPILGPPLNSCGGAIKDSYIRGVQGGTGSVCMNALTPQDIESNDGANWYHTPTRQPQSAIQIALKNIITKQNGIVLPNPAMMVSRDGEGKEPEQSVSHNSSCMGIHYARIRARDNNSTGVWVLRGSAENHQKWDEVVSDYKARVPVYNKTDFVELVKLAGGVYYENEESIPAWHNLTRMERILDGEVQATKGLVEKAWEELKAMSNRTEALRVEALASEGLKKWLNHTLPHGLGDYPTPSNKSEPNVRGLDNAPLASTSDSSEHAKRETESVGSGNEESRNLVTGDSPQKMNPHHIKKSSAVNSEQQGPQTSVSLDSFPWITSRDNKNADERQGSPQPVTPDNSFPWIATRGDEDEDDTQQAISSQPPATGLQ